jgi:V/A-type H+-transporting ATPase subunit G/H
MREVVDTILKAEEEAKRRIAEAREQAKKITADAEVEARRLVESEREAAHKRARELVDGAIAEAKTERAAKLESTHATVDDLKDVKGDAMRRAVEKAYQRIVRVERA